MARILGRRSAAAPPEAPPVPVLPRIAAAEEWWLVEVGDGRTWTTETNGPHRIYENPDEAMAWAKKLKLIHQLVRIKHSMTYYIEV